MINKFLCEKGGSETYIFRLGTYLEKQGHEVAYFGMDHPERLVGNPAESYTGELDFHHSPMLTRLSYPFRIIYSTSARRKIRAVLDAFEPDVCHLNLFNFQLTPSIILEIRRWEKKKRRRIQLVYTAHDYQMVCPDHMLYDPNTGEICEDCTQGSFSPCWRRRCIHHSWARSVLGAVESALWHRSKAYDSIDTVICCSRFMESVLEKDRHFKGKTVVLHNFIDGEREAGAAKKLPVPEGLPSRFVLYTGRLSPEKGIDLLIQAARSMPDIPFLVAGEGPLLPLLKAVPNIRCLGFLKAASLRAVLRAATLSVCPSVWYENCPFVVLESLRAGIPVIGSRSGGIPELIQDGKNGLLFEPACKDELVATIRRLWTDADLQAHLRQGAAQSQLMTIESYYERLLPLYCGAGSGPLDHGAGSGPLDHGVAGGLYEQQP